MGLIELLFLAVGLSMDAFAVSLTNGMVHKNISRKKTLFIAFVFGFLQFLMPLLGYVAGSFFISYIQQFDHWVAAGLLWFLSLKMIIEGLRKHSDVCSVQGHLRIADILLQGVATSIDALVVGLSLAAVNTPIVSSALIIGIVTFTLCLLAIIIGKKTRGTLGNKAEIVGGLVLFTIGLRILISDLFG